MNTLVLALLAAILIASAIYNVVKYLRICREDERCRVYMDEYRDWQWPERKAGPVGRTHLGRHG